MLIISFSEYDTNSLKANRSKRSRLHQCYFCRCKSTSFKALCKVYNYVIGIFAFRGTKHAKLVLQLRDHCKVLLETSGV